MIRFLLLAVSSLNEWNIRQSIQSPSAIIPAPLTPQQPGGALLPHRTKAAPLRGIWPGPRAWEKRSMSLAHSRSAPKPGPAAARLSQNAGTIRDSVRAGGAGVSSISTIARCSEAFFSLKSRTETPCIANWSAIWSLSCLYQ